MLPNTQNSFMRKHGKRMEYIKNRYDRQMGSRTEKNNYIDCLECGTI